MRIKRDKVVEVTAPPTGRRVLSRKELLRRIPYSYPHIWKLMRAGKFPCARKLYGRSVWFEDEIDAFLNDLSMRQYKRAE
jgi:predicted DNA-binding transcriptional regulator AlpA